MNSNYIKSLTNENPSERSKCVICGKKRERTFLKKLFSVWVCNYEIGYHKENLVYLKSFDSETMRQFNKCQIVLLQNHLKQIEILQHEVNKNIVLMDIKNYNLP